MKICTKCHIEKDNDSFCKKKTGAGGINSVCRECVKKESTLYYSKNKKRIIEYQLMWAKLNKNKRKVYCDLYYSNNYTLIRNYQNIYEKKKIELISDRYIRSLIRRKSPGYKELINEYPEIIDVYRQNIKFKRFLLKNKLMNNEK